MFATFTTSMDARTRKSTAGASAKPKRTRACDRCREYRVKCDDGQPCRSCRTRGVTCSKEVAARDRSPASPRNALHNGRNSEAYRVRETEAEGWRRKPDQEDSHAQVTSRTAQMAMPSMQPKDARMQTPPGSNEHTPSPAGPDSSRLHRRMRRQWPGVWIAHPGTNDPHNFGPMSPYHLASRLSVYIETDEIRSPLAIALKSFGISTGGQPLRPEASMNAAGFGIPYMSTVNNQGPQMDSLTRQQEEYLLSTFWQSHYTIAPIVNDFELREHHSSLWTQPRTSELELEQTRQPSALVDVILALCMQHSATDQSSASETSFPTGQGVEDSSQDAGEQGRWLCERCQTLLRAGLDMPSLLSVQCHIFSTIYLINLGSTLPAQRMLSNAISAAYALGLQHEPPECLDRAQRALRRRIWWTLFCLDMMLSLQQGRPCFIQTSGITIELPTDDRQEAVTAGAGIAIYHDISWLSYNTQTVKLMMAFRRIWDTFTAKCIDAMSTWETNDVYETPALLEQCASILAQNMDPLSDWTKQVPSPLKLPRKEMGHPFSATRGPVDPENFIPLWLQRQRVLLELQYHHLVISLHRPFIRFPTTSQASSCSSSALSPTPTADSHAVTAMKHALATIHIIHQILTETDLLNSWHAIFHYTWEAAITLIAFSFVRPLCTVTASGRKALDMAIRAFDLFHGFGFASAQRAAAIVRDLTVVLDEKLRGLRRVLTRKPDTPSGGSTTLTPLSLGQQTASGRPSHSPAGMQPSVQREQGGLVQLDGNGATYVADVMDLSIDMLGGFGGPDGVVLDGLEVPWEPELGLWVHGDAAG